MLLQQPSTSSQHSSPSLAIMPHKKRSTPLRRHYSRDLKKRVIYQAFTLGKSSTAIAVDLDMPLRVVQRIKRTWFEIGEVCRDRSYKGRHPLLSPLQTKVSIEALEKCCLLIQFSFYWHYWNILRTCTWTRYKNSSANSTTLRFPCGQSLAHSSGLV